MDRDERHEIRPDGTSPAMPDDTPSTPTALGNRQGRPQSEHSGVSGPAILHPDPRTILAPATAIVLDDNTSEESRESDEILESSVTGSSNRTSMTTETQATSLDYISTKTESDSVDSDNFSIAESLKDYFPDTDIAQTTDDESAMESRCADCEEVGITQCGISVAYFFLTLFQILQAGQAFELSRLNSTYIAAVELTSTQMATNGTSTALDARTAASTSTLTPLFSCSETGNYDAPPAYPTALPVKKRLKTLPSL